MKIGTHVLAWASRYRAGFSPAELAARVDPAPHGPAQLTRRRNLPGAPGS